MNKTWRADLPDSDKILNFRESLEPYHLENYLKGYYTAKEILSQFRSRLNPDQMKKLEPLTHPTPLQAAHLFVVKDGNVRQVNREDVKNALHLTLKILKRSDQ